MIFHKNCLPADNSHEISCLIGYFWKSREIWYCLLLQIIGGVLWVNLNHFHPIKRTIMQTFLAVAKSKEMSEKSNYIVPGCRSFCHLIVLSYYNCISFRLDSVTFEENDFLLDTTPGFRKHVSKKLGEIIDRSVCYHFPCSYLFLYTEGKRNATTLNCYLYLKFTSKSFLFKFFIPFCATLELSKLSPIT